MGKHMDKLGAFDSFRAPWETEGGTDAEIDKSKLKRLIFNLKLGEAKALDDKDDVNERIATIESDLEEAKKQAADASGAEAQKKIDRLEKQLSDLTSERDALVKAKEVSELRAEVLGDLEARYAKYVVGDTKEDLEKSLAQVKEDFGLSSGGDDGGDDDGDDSGTSGRTLPRPRLRNASDPAADTPPAETDFDRIAEQIIGGGRVFG